MSTSFIEWSQQRLSQIGVNMPNADWTRIEIWKSSMGTVQSSVDGWVAFVVVGNSLIKVKGEYDSAAVAMGVVERVWKREEEKRNG